MSSPRVCSTMMKPMVKTRNDRIDRSTEPIVSARCCRRSDETDGSDSNSDRARTDTLRRGTGRPLTVRDTSRLIVR